MTKSIVVLTFLFGSGLIGMRSAYPQSSISAGLNSARDKEPNRLVRSAGDTVSINKVIMGTLVDSTSGKPVAFATVALIRQPTGKLVDGITSDEQGRFSLSPKEPGSYRLQYSAVGYQKRNSRPFTWSETTPVNLGSVLLLTDVRTLSEIVVTGQAALIEEKVDRLVFNAEKDITAKGGNASDILKRVPMLDVDLDGNVSMRGSQNIRVLINNKPSTLVAASVADALKQIPADQIKSVEVITSPSAKYDAEGAAGVINIITKKNTLNGLNLTVNAGAGLRASDLGLNGSFRQGKLGLTLGGNGMAFYNRGASTLDQTTLVGAQQLRTQQQASSSDRGFWGNYTLGFDYDLTPNQSLSGAVRFGGFRFRQQQTQATSTSALDSLLSTMNRDVNRQNSTNSVDVNLDYIHTFNKDAGGPQREWSVSTQYSRTNLVNNFLADILNGADVLTARQQNLNNNTNQELTLQTDYQTAIRKRGQLEFGGKAILRQVNSQYAYWLGGAIGELLPDPTNPAGSLSYGQTIGAGYVAYSYVTPSKYTIKVGTRYEYTGISARMDGSRTGGSTAMQNEGNTVLTIPSYGSLVPSLNASKALSDKTTLKVAYNRRIQRPGLQQLNPNPNAANPQLILVGNPTLRPELTDNVEFSVSSTIKKTYLNLAFFGRTTDNAIAQIRIPSDSIPGGIVMTYQNIGVQRTVGTNLFFNTNLTAKWSVNGGVDVYYLYLQGTTPGVDGRSMTISNTGVNLGGRLMSQLQIGKGWSAQAFSFWRGSTPQLQGRQGSFYWYSVGIRKDLPNKRGNVGLAADNFIGNGTTVRTTLDSPLLSQVSVNQFYNANLKLTVSYRIGKLNTEPTRRKTRSVSNDDLKTEGGDNNGGRNR